MLFMSAAMSQRYAGVVSDELGPIPGASVFEKGTTNGMVTDLDGKYSITVSQEGAVLVFSYLGYKTIEITTGENKQLNVQMGQDVMGLEELIVVGYGQTQNKRSTTTAMTTVDSKKFEELPVSRPEQVLQGNAPGAMLAQESGSPGAPMTIRLRGVATAGNSNPLILLDGVQVPDMSFVNGADIAEVTVLKDAASTAIYGARGGNGVLLVTTKNGSAKPMDKPVFTFGSYTGVQQLANTGDYLNGQQYAEYYNNSIDYLEYYELPVNGRDRFTDEEIALLPNTNWVEAITDNALMTNHTFSIKDGSERSSYYLSGGLFYQDGIVGKSETGFQRQTLSAGMNNQVNAKLRIGTNLYYANNSRSWIAENTENGGVMSAVMSLPSIYPTHEDSAGLPFNNGNMSGVEYNGVSLNTQPELGNPFLSMLVSDNQMTMNNIMASGQLQYDLAKNITFNATVSHLSRSVLLKNFTSRYNYEAIGYINDKNSYVEQAITDAYTQSEQYITYAPEIGVNHKLDFIAGSTQLQNDFLLTYRSGTNFITNSIEEVNFATIVDDEDEIIGNDNAYRNTTLSFFSRANYALKSKYLFSATFRADGSSKFGPNNRWGYFPAVSAGWLISDEEFMKGLSWVTLLKLRSSYGINGNDQIAPYQYQSRYIRGQGSLALQDVNENIKWEEVAQFNVGVDMNMFKDRIGVTLDYYDKTTTDMLLNFPNPALLGSPAPVRNAANVRNNGVELLVAYKDDWGENWSVDFGFNMAYNKNEVTALGGGEPIEAASARIFKDAPNLTRTDEGQPIASFYGYVFEGLDSTGNIQYKDLNGDGEIDAANDRTYLGNPYPDWTFGATLGAKYKQFDVSIFLQGVTGNEIVNASTQYGVQYTNRTTRVLDAWMPDAMETDVARPSALNVANHQFSDYYIENGSYLRIKNLTFGYSLGKDALKKIKSTQLRMYLSAQNLLTWTAYSGLDPEIGANNGNPLDVGIDRGFYPAARTILAGVQYQF